jgi:hypothetical protein
MKSIQFNKLNLSTVTLLQIPTYFIANSEKHAIYNIIEILFLYASNSWRQSTDTAAF